MSGETRPEWWKKLAKLWFKNNETEEMQTNKAYAYGLPLSKEMLLYFDELLNSEHIDSVIFDFDGFSAHQPATLPIIAKYEKQIRAYLDSDSLNSHLAYNVILRLNPEETVPLTLRLLEEGKVWEELIYCCANNNIQEAIPFLIRLRTSPYVLDMGGWGKGNRFYIRDLAFEAIEHILGAKFPRDSVVGHSEEGTAGYYDWKPIDTWLSGHKSWSSKLADLFGEKSKDI
jgi:hypothetical protein